MTAPTHASLASAAPAVPALLRALRLPTMGRLWEDLCHRATEAQWSHQRLLQALLEHEVAERDERRIAARRQAARLPPGKTLASFDVALAPGLDRPRLDALASGDGWLGRGGNVLLFGPSGVGKTHLAAALGHALIDRGHTVLFSRTTDLVQHLQAARRDLELPQSLAKIDRYDCLVLDDLGYVRKDQAETSVLFELISQAYERRSLIITCNQPFSEWDAIFPDKAMTVAAVDRLVHHASIVQLGGDSYRRRSANARKPATNAS